MFSFEFLLTTITLYISLIAGYVIIHLAKEELKPGLKYFKALSHFLAIIAASLTAYFGSNLLAFIIGIGYLISLFSSHFLYINYLLFSITLPLMYSYYPGFISLSAVVFAFGLVNGPLIYNKPKKLLYLIYFILIANLIMLVL